VETDFHWGRIRKEHFMKTNNTSRFEAFLSLGWYEVFLRFIANFVAKSAELLLAAGLVVSSANFLTDGDVLGTGSAASKAWSWTQALAIDASLGISFYYVLQCLKQRDWVKFVLYSLLTLVLTLVAGIITDGDIFSHAMHAPIHNAMDMLGIDIRLLSILRSIAVVGFVLMSRLRDVSFKDISAPEPNASSSSPINLESMQTVSSNTDPVVPQIPQFAAEDIARLLQRLLHANGITMTEVAVGPSPLLSDPATEEQQDQRKLLPHAESTAPVEQAPQPEAPSPLPTQQLTGAEIAPPDKEIQVQPPVEPDPQRDPEGHPSQIPAPPEGPQFQSGTAPVPNVGAKEAGPLGREERMERAYQELLKEGQKISGRTLAERAHVHRARCVEWLRERRWGIQGYQRAEAQGDPEPPEMPWAEGDPGPPEIPWTEGDLEPPEMPWAEGDPEAEPPEMEESLKPPVEDS
jgi:hypothetical protein